MKEKKEKGRHVFGQTVLITILLAIAIELVFAWQIAAYEDGILDVNAFQQDAYVKLVLDQINLEDNRTNEEIIEKILATLDTTGSRYWTLSENHTMLYVQNVSGSNTYRNLTAESYYSDPSAADFFSSLEKDRVIHREIRVEGQEYVASGALFSYNGSDYKLCLLSDREALLNNNKYLAAKVNLYILVTAACVLLIFLPSFFAYRYRKEQLKNAELRKENAELGKNLEGASRRLFKRAYSSAYLMPNGRGHMKTDFNRSYQMKFYLNARHYIWIGGEKGAPHPHTWEFGLTIGFNSSEFVEFRVFEKGIDEFLAPYQNQLLNEVAPFDQIVPTLENMTDEFSGPMAGRIADAGGTLLKIEASETPTRSYVIELGKKDKADD